MSRMIFRSFGSYEHLAEGSAQPQQQAPVPFSEGAYGSASAGPAPETART
jgi:hypothetical protein